MKDFETRDNAACHIFHDCEDCSVALKAISDWWDLVPEDTAKTIEVIRFDVDNFDVDDNGMIDVHVFWSYMSKENQAKIEAMAMELGRLPNIDSEDIGTN